jgi:hypothetical protein
MDKKCPCCGNTTEFTPTMINEEYVCDDCGSEFSESTSEAYTAPNYRLFCENVIKRMRSNLQDSILSAAIGELKEGYINDGPDYTKDFIDRLSNIATELYVDYRAGLREEYDFAAIMEGVEKLIEFYNLQNPQDDEFTNANSEESTDIPMDDDEEEESNDIEIQTPSEMSGDESSNSNPASINGEKIEHLALATLKSNADGLQTAIELLSDAEEQENHYGSSEDPSHEEQEGQIISKLKAAIVDIQTNINEYLQGENNAHYSAPDIRRNVDVISEEIQNISNISEISKMKSDLQNICTETRNLLRDCGVDMGEDAQLVSQGYVDDQLTQSIDTNTDEFGNVVEATIGGQNIDPVLVGPEGSEPPSIEDQEASMDQGSVDGFNSAQEFNDAQPRGYADIPDSFGQDPTLNTDLSLYDSPENGDDVENIDVGDFKVGNDVIFENEHWTIKEMNNGVASLESYNGEMIDVNKEDIELSDRHGFDEMEAHYKNGTDNLRKEWEKIEKSIDESSPLMQATRSFDPTKFKSKKLGIENFDPEATLPVTKKSPKGLNSFKNTGAIQLPKGGTPAEQKNKPFDPEERIGGKGFGVAYEDSDEPKLPNSNVQI